MLNIISNHTKVYTEYIVVFRTYSVIHYKQKIIYLNNNNIRQYINYFYLLNRLSF